MLSFEKAVQWVLLTSLSMLLFKTSPKHHTEESAAHFSRSSLLATLYLLPRAIYFLS